ncbi:MAG: nucleotidyltransferase family protein [Magnetococcales bacterium]|nr:nucleotidyltransferase family protein [Magnetococcales bacterium]
MADDGEEGRDWEVVILCGGRGVRLKPLTDRVPKGMVPVNGRPMLDHVVEFYRRHGARRVHFCIGYRGEVIRDHFAQAPPGLDCRFFDAGEEAGMLERLWEVREAVGERFVVAYCDTMIDLDLARLLAHHRRLGAGVTLVTSAIRNPFGVVGVGPEGWVERFEEKPVFTYFIGCFVMEKWAFREVAPAMLAQPDGAGLVTFFQHLIGLGRLGAFDHQGLQISFNTESEHRQAERDLQRFFTYREQS